MIRQDIVNAIRASTCAVVRLDERHEDFLARVAAGDPDERIKSTAVGTAFLVRDNVAVTNQHVIEDIHEEEQSIGHHEHWYLEFAYRKPGNSWGTTHVRIKNTLGFIDPTGGGKVDVGFLQFAREVSEAFESCVPVQFGDLRNITVGADIGVCVIRSEIPF